MKPLPKEFLDRIANEYDLTAKQKEAFVAYFQSPNKTQEFIADELDISGSAFRVRLQEIYKKFSINKEATDKARELHDILWRKYKERHSEAEAIQAAARIEEKNEIEALVQQVREKICPDIKQRCGTMQVLDMTQPIGLGDIYTNVNILEKITSRRRLGLADLQENCNFDLAEFNRFGFGKVEERVPGLEAVAKHSKLMVWGKPGAGKTTFLKYLAIQCNAEEVQKEKVPIFITLKAYAETENKPKLIKYIQALVQECEIDDSIIEQLLKKGKVFLLLDGLDEVKTEDSSRVLTEIQQFTNRHKDNQFIVTCRIAAKEYTFQGFTEVEVADFDEDQIAVFVNNWFRQKDKTKAKRFLEKIEDNKPIQELASSPLLLTLLCLVFEETNDFPQNRSELYKEGLDVLLKKWDIKRNIEREIVYKKLSIKRKEDLLSQVAFTTFDQGNYFFKQKEVEKYIADYIRNLPDAKADPEALLLDSEAVLKSIEAQHGLLVERAKGIYSFSHLTFHEYFTARKIALATAKNWQTLTENLISHVTERRWREVFLLVSEMTEDATEFMLLLKQEIDNLVAADEKIQQFLGWAAAKATSANAAWTSEAKQKIIEKTNIILTLDLSFSRNLYLYLSQNLSTYMDIYLSLYTDLYLSLDIDIDLSLYLQFYLQFSLPLAINRAVETAAKLDFKLAQALQNLKAQLPSHKQEEEFREWWEQNGRQWREDLRAVMIRYRNIGHDWQFSEEQKDLLAQYYEANQLLTQCLHSECYVDREVRQEIEETIFLPQSALQQRPPLG